MTTLLTGSISLHRCSHRSDGFRQRGKLSCADNIFGIESYMHIPLDMHLTLCGSGVSFRFSEGYISQFPCSANFAIMPTLRPLPPILGVLLAKCGDRTTLGDHHFAPSIRPIGLSVWGRC